jgi:hypothetical protein
MKATTRSNVYLSMVAMILMAALAVPAAAQQVPFKGTFQGNDTVNPPTITTAATEIGTGFFGKLSLINVLTFLTSGPAGTGHWTAANGDRIDSTFVVSATPGDGVLNVTEFHTITGGTGRFSGAQGNITVHRTHILDSPDGTTHITFGSFEGIITSLRSAH